MCTVDASRTAFDRWIFDSFTVTPGGLGLYRIAFALYGLFFLAPGHTAYTQFTPIASFPSVFFTPPPGPFALFPGFPPAYALEGLHLALNVSLVALLFGYRTRLFSVLLFFLYLIGYGFLYSFGKINHNLLYILLPLVMAGSGWGQAYSFDAWAGRRRPVQAWPLTMLALLLGFAMFTAGFAKLLGGWLDPDTHATLGHLIKQYFVNGRQDLLAPYLTGVEAPLLWESLDYATVLFEMGFLVAIIHPVSTRLFVVFAVFFHVGTMLVLNIAFTPHHILYAAFLDWPRIHRALRASLSAVQWPYPFSESVAVGTVGVVGLVFYAVGSPLLWIEDMLSFSSDLLAVDVLAISLAAAVTLGVCGAYVRRTWRAHTRTTAC